MNASSAPGVVLLHGWGGSFESTWVRNGWVDALKAHGRRVFEIDLPGHGKSPRWTHPEDYSMLTELVGQKVPDDGVFDLIGYSLGAKLALALAARDGGRYRRLVVAGLGGNAFAPERMGDVVAAALEDGMTDSTPPPVRRFVDYALSAGNDPRALAAVLRRPPNPVLTPTRLMWLRGPTLVIAGDKDTTALPLEPLLDALPHAESRLLPGIDHLGLPASREFLDAALTFIA